MLELYYAETLILVWFMNNFNTCVIIDGDHIRVFSNP
jgi:hypothetical protein